MASPDGAQPGYNINPGEGMATFFGFYIALVLIMGLWSRHVARRVHFGDIQNRLRRFNQLMGFARLMIPTWFGVGIYLLGWKTLVMQGFAQTPLGGLRLDTPGILIGSLPAFLAWMGLWWAQYPADFALREQNLLIQLNESLPVHQPPGFWSYFGVNFRLQLLFSIAPILVLLALRDILGLVLPPIFHQISWLRDQQSLIEATISVPSAGAILLLGPEILRRVLDTEPLPDSPLRRRLEDLCRQHNVGFHEVLLWKTRHQMGNAAVMGFVPRFRYFLMSDLLLETMSDEQIEAVFAHEIGHIKHKHLFWLLASVAGLMLGMAGPGSIIVDAMEHLHQHMWLPETLQMIILMGGGLAIFALFFGYVSRKFERQADVFAARTLQAAYDAAISASALSATGTEGASAVAVFPRLAFAPPHQTAEQSFVGRYGAQIFCSALERVATVNNIPIAARSWCHGSIARRMRFLFDLGRDPRRTFVFDSFMSKLYISLILILCLFGAWTMVNLYSDKTFSNVSTSANAAIQIQR